MPPYLGQGANQAIADAHVLAEAIAGIDDEHKDLASALQAYENQRKNPVEAILQSSRIIGLLETQGGLLGTTFRNYLFRFAGASGVVPRAFITAAKPVEL